MAEVELIVEIPVANSFKFTLDDVPVNQRANFDQQRFQQSRHATTKREREYRQMVEKTDPSRVQYYSNFPLQRLRIIDCDENIYSPITGAIDSSAFYTPSIAVQYKGKKYRSDCKFASVDGKLFIYFTQGVEYLDYDFTITGSLVDLNGVLPNINAQVGDILRYKIGVLDFASAAIEEIVWVPSLEAEGYLTDVDYMLSDSVDGLVEVSYNEKSADLYAQLVNFSNLPAGEYFLRLEFGVTEHAEETYTTEPLDIQEEHEDSQALVYSHKGTFDQVDIWSYVYLGNWTNIIRVPANFFKYKPAGEIESDTDDSGVPRMTRAVPSRTITFEAFEIPNWLCDKFSVIFSHDTKQLNEYYWENEGLGNYEGIGDINLGNFSIDLKQVNDRTKKVDRFTAALTASFTPSSVTGIAFGGDTEAVLFNTNSGATFSFLTLPSWLTADKETFVDGDTITFTIAANATQEERSIILIAVTESFSELQAELEFQQDYDESTPNFITVSSNALSIPGTAGAQGIIYITASGTWEAIDQSGWDYNNTSILGDTAVQINEESQNNDGSPRVGTVRVRLVAFPSVFQDIVVTQAEFAGLTSLSPGSDEVGPGGETLLIDVTAQVGTTWQATSNQDAPAPDAWISFDTTVKSGSVNDFAVTVFAKPPYIPPRVATVTFVNTLNPLNTVTLTINQTS